MNSPHITARIPSELEAKVDTYLDTFPGTKTDLVVQALSKFIEYEAPKTETQLLTEELESLKNNQAAIAEAILNMKDIEMRPSSIRDLREIAESANIGGG